MPYHRLLLLLLMGLVKADETCLSVIEDPYLFFGTKTAYIFANRDNPSTKIHDVPGCQPQAAWLLNRHGSHNPEANEIRELQELVDLKNNVITNYRNNNFRDTNERICSADLNLLERWEWDSRKNLTFAGDLTSEGYMTTQQLGQAWKNKFPGVLTTNRLDYSFKFVNDQRSSNSFKAFTEGIFGAQADGLDIPKIQDEKLLRPYKLCPAWTKDVEENNDTLTQLNIFESKLEYREMISNVSRRLGFNWDIKKETVKNIYLMCRYNKAWAVERISPWCAAFTREDLRRLEYGEDLEAYYKYGYGTEYSEKIGCTLVKDMMEFLNKQVASGTPQQPRTKVHFTEAAMLLMTLTAMGVRRDQAPLTGDNYHSALVQSRKWATSTMAPFNGNLAAVLYKCTQNGNFQVKDEYQVFFLENEKPLYIEGCRVGLCDWSLVKAKFSEIANKCNLDFCNSATKINSLGAIMVAVVVFILNFM